MSAPATYAFLHGGGQGSWVWEPVIAALTAQSVPLRALALDVPGCGTKRGRDTSALTFDDIAAELLADLEAAGLENIILVGHSQAGQIMPHLLTARPELFRRAIYLSCSIPHPGQTVLEMIGTGTHGQNPDEVGWPLDPATHSMQERFIAMFCNDMSAAETTAFLSRLGADAWPPTSYTNTDWRHPQLGPVPASYILCLRDNILPPPWQEEFARRFKTDRTIRLDAGHQAMTTRPHALAEILRAEAL